MTASKTLEHSLQRICRSSSHVLGRSRWAQHEFGIAQPHKSTRHKSRDISQAHLHEHFLPIAYRSSSTMVSELNYNTISHVIESWEQLRRIRNYEEKAGVLLFQRLFQKCPQAKLLFGFPVDIDPSSPELLSSKRFLMHASYLVQMLDTALNMLGPDIELLTEIMMELGEKHVRYGVKPEMFPVMGEALIHTLETTLKSDFTPQVRQAWLETYKELSQDMIRAQAKTGKRGSHY